jgi:hypothetical protein
MVPKIKRCRIASERAPESGVELGLYERETRREILALGTLLLGVGFAGEAAAEQSRYSKALQQACMADYKKLCGEYGIETAARRTCMDKNGHSLTKTCLDALIDARSFLA